jgi:hypothetical protein
MPKEKFLDIYNQARHLILKIDIKHKRLFLLKFESNTSLCMVQTSLCTKWTIYDWVINNGYCALKSGHDYQHCILKINCMAWGWYHVNDDVQFQELVWDAKHNWHYKSYMFITSYTFVWNVGFHRFVQKSHEFCVTVNMNGICIY